MNIKDYKLDLTQDLDHIFQHTENLWEELRGKKLFVTGGTGFFGKWLLESFLWVNKKLELNAQMHVLSRDPESFKTNCLHLANKSEIKYHQGDVRNFDFPDGKFDYIIHAATSASAKLNSENPLLMFNTIVEGTRHILDFAVHCNAQKFLLTSSGAVYGEQHELKNVSENHCGAPDPIGSNSAYGVGKRASEFLCGAYSQKYGIEMKIARCFTFVGPYLPLDIHYAIGNFIRDGLNNKTIKVNGDGTPYRSYLYAADLAIWLWTILFKGKSMRTYNVGSEEAITISGLANIVVKCFKKTLQVKIAETPEPGSITNRYVPSTKRAREECNLHQTISLREAIERTIKIHSIISENESII
ncbi:MAG: NAD-dependent epimerase/dehydratase family protein [Desulfobacterales bacterium]|nr:NAD-dependent epimerase/dehydratase family protein [Desulfobacterales bacterium]